MNKLIFCIFSVILIVSFRVTIHGQIIVEEEITTDTIDIFSMAQTDINSSKSSKLAIWGNILLPGLGHQYLRKDNRAIVYFATEAICILGMIFNKRYSKKLYDDSRSYAWAHANTKNLKPIDHNYWEIIGKEHFLNFKQYNNAVELNGEYDKKLTDPNDLWNWESDTYQNKYRDIRENAMRFHVISTFFLGAMFLNRIVSFIDIRVISKYQSIQSQSKKIIFKPEFILTDNIIGLSVSRNF